MLDWFKQAGGGPSSNAGIWHLYKQQYDAQQTGAAQTPKLPPLSTLFPLLRLWPWCRPRQAERWPP
jgi:hypothetical protein